MSFGQKSSEFREPWSNRCLCWQQGNIYIFMARRGKAEEAFEQALALNRPEPRTPALLKVAEACLWKLKQNKQRKEGQDNP